MTARTISHSAPAGRSAELHASAERLYALLSSGHEALAYNVDARGPALTKVLPDGKRRPVSTSGIGLGDCAPPWQRARELVEGGVEVDRRFNAWVLERHLRGKYSVAPAAPGWVQWVALDIDAHPARDLPELSARRQAKQRADRVLADVWRAFGCSAERHPLVLRSPGGGYHVWFPLTRGEGSSNPEHTWPALVARAWFERHLMAAGLDLAPGVLEIFPAGRCLRAPCGAGMMLLQATRPHDPDALGLVPWPGTMASHERVDWKGQRPSLSTPVRRVLPMVQAFVAQWEAQQRTIADWLGRPEACWDSKWGFLGWRVEEIPPLKTEKKIGSIFEGKTDRSQESVDVPGRLQAQGPTPMSGVAGGWDCGARRTRSRARSAIPEDQDPPTALRVDVPPVPAGETQVRGRAFKEKVRRLLLEGITKPSSRHDAVLTLSFYWAATCGLGELGALSRLEAWCKAHPHGGSRLAARPRAFRDTCLREARHYIVHHSSRWRFRGRGDGGGLATLTEADQAVISAVDPRVQGEASTVLAWLAGRADGEGRVGAPVEISSGLLARLCGDRRIADEGKRRRAVTLALAELERLGLLTLAHNYRVGQRGRVWSCWYQFGSGKVPRAIEMPVAAWEALGPPVPSPPVGTPAAVSEAPSVSTSPCETTAATVSVEELPVVSSERVASAPAVALRVVGEQAIPEGVVKVLSDGARGLPRTLLALAPDVARPTVAPSPRAPWFVRPFQARTFTPAELRAVSAAEVIPFPDLAQRRRMTRAQRLAWGGGLTPARRAEPWEPASASSMSPTSGPDRPVPPAPGDPPGDVRGASIDRTSSPHLVSLAPSVPVGVPTPSTSTEPAALRAELAAEVGEGAADLPLDLVDVVAYAWRAFRRGRDP